VRRVTIVVVVWLVTLVALARVYVAVMGDVAERRGVARYQYRANFEAQLAETMRTRPAVVWLGDSTIMAFNGPSYPQLIKGGVAGVSSVVAGFPGADAYAFYPFVAGLLEYHRPLVLVLVASLRLFSDPVTERPRTRTRHNDLWSMLPTSALPRAMQLPLETRGLTVPGLLTVRLLRIDHIEHAFFVQDGARALVSEAEVSWLGPNQHAGRTLQSNMLEQLRASEVPVTPSYPTVRMLGATVRLGREAGVRVIVVASPIPIETMDRSIGYDASAYQARFDTLRDAVVDAGGVFVDLHEALAYRFFEDAAHFNRGGADELAARLRPILIGQVTTAFRERPEEAARASALRSNPRPAPAAAPAAER
jgi:hypothetical protein